MIKRGFYYLVSGIYFFLSTYILPLFFLIAFNYGKGIQNNEDGILFIPFGFLLIILTVLIDVFLIRKAVKMNSRHKWLVVAVLLLLFIIAVILTSSIWSTFFECLGHYKGLNLGLQR